MGSRTAAAIKATSPDELMTVLKRYLRESNENEIVVASPDWRKPSYPSSLADRKAKSDERKIGANRVLPQACRIPVSALRLVSFANIDFSVPL